MLLGPKGAGVFDFDAICATHPAMDIARFAAVIVRREPARLDRAEAALARLLESYGEAPPDLDWWLAAQILCQVGSPFRKAWADWPEKVEGIVAAAETVLDRTRVGGTRPPAVRGNGSRRAGRLVMITSGFPRRSETFALNELLALERAGELEAVFATKPGDGAEPHPGSEPPARARPCAARRAAPPSRPRPCWSDSTAARVSAVHAYFAHEPAAVAVEVARRLDVPYGFSVHARDARKVRAERLAERVRGAACVIACNPDVVADLPERGGQVHLVPARRRPGALPPDAASGAHRRRRSCWRSAGSCRRRASTCWSRPQRGSTAPSGCESWARARSAPRSSA